MNGLDENLEEEKQQYIKKLVDSLEKEIKECKEFDEELVAVYRGGMLTTKELKDKRIEMVYDSWNNITGAFGEDEKNILVDELDKAYQTLFAAVDIPVRKVPVRRYPGVKFISGSLCYLSIKNADSLFYDSNPIEKTFKYKFAQKMGNTEVLLDYCFQVKKEEFELEKKGMAWEGWKCYDGYGKLEGYNWAEASIHVRENNGKIQCVTLWKTYVRVSDPIWKRRSFSPIEDYEWVGIYEDISDDFEIPPNEFYYDETLNPPKGRHYKEYGILAYDDTDEIVILGIKDAKAEIVEIPSEINGKPVTVLDERCFENCNKTLKKVILPNSLKEIGDYAFVGCEALEKPIIPNSVVKIGKRIFDSYYRG